jgi:hypothetical protein
MLTVSISIPALTHSIVEISNNPLIGGKNYQLISQLKSNHYYEEFQKLALDF